MRQDNGRGIRTTGTLGSRLDRRDLLRRAAALGLGAPALAALGAMAARSATAAQTAPANLKGKLSFWHGLSGSEESTLTNTIVPAWKAAYPDVSLTVLKVPFDQLQNKYSTEASSGGGPDVLLGPSDWVGGYAEGDLILAVNDLAGPSFDSGYNPASVEGITYNGKVYGVPQNINGVALFYNKTLVPTPPKTTDELLQMAGQIASGGKSQYGFGLISNLYSNAGYLFGLGGNIFTPDDKSAFDSQETVAFLDLLKKIKDAPGVFAQADQGAIESLFKEKKAAMLFDGPWFLQDARSALGTDAVGVAILPAISSDKDAPAKPFVGVTALYLNANDQGDQAKLAFTFAQWFSTTGTQALANQAAQIPASTSVKVPENDPIAQTFVEQYRVGVALPTNPKMANVWTPAGDMITKVLAGQLSAQQAAQQTAKTIDSSGS